MAKNERTSSKVGTLASGVLRGAIKPTPAQVRTLAATALTQRPNNSRKK